MNVYATPEQIIDYLASLDSIDLNNLESAKAREAKLIKQFAIQASRKFEAHCHQRRFYPTLETRYYDYSLSPLCVDDDLLEVVTLTTNNGTTTIPASDYYLSTGAVLNWPPYDRINLLSDGSQPNFLFSGTPQRANAVTAYWGYHDEWDSAWSNSQDTVQNNPLSASATTLTVSSTVGADDLGVKPRFQTYQLLRIESEYLFVTDVVNITTLTVVRGANGTAAASHVQTTQIDIYRPMAEITNALLTLATFVYKRRSAIGTTADRAVTQQGIFVLPSRLPDEVTSMIEIYKPL